MDTADCYYYYNLFITTTFSKAANDDYEHLHSDKLNDVHITRRILDGSIGMFTDDSLSGHCWTSFHAHLDDIIRKYN